MNSATRSFTLPNGENVTLFVNDRGARVGQGETTLAWWMVKGRMTRRSAEALALEYVTETLRAR